MAVKQKAIGVGWGTKATGITYTAAATVLKQKTVSEDYKKLSDLVEVKDQNGEVNGLIFFNPRKELSLRCYPTDTALATGLAAAGTIGMEIGDKVVVTAADDPDIAGTYIAIEVGKARVNDNIVFFDIMVREYATDLSADTA